MNRFLITISAVLITLSGFSVTATKEYVDRQDAETLQAAKDYADQHGGGGGGVDTNAVRDIAREEITPATNRLNQTLSDALAAKRDKSDRAVYSGTRTENTDWTWESENKELEAALNDATAKPTYDSENHLWVITGTTHWGKFYYNSPGVYDVDALSVRLAFITIPDYVDYYATATRPRYMDEALGPAKPNQQLAAVATDDAAKPADGSLMKYDAANDRFVKATAGTDYADEAKGTNRQVVRGLVFDETKWNISVASSEYAREAEHAREAGSVMWSFVEAKPTTLSGYGITDGATTEEVDEAKATANEAKATANEANAYSVATYNFMNGNTNAWFAGTNYVFGADATNKHHFAFEDGMDLPSMPCSMALCENRDGIRQNVWDQRDWVSWYWSFKAGQMRREISATNAEIRAAMTNYAPRAWSKMTAATGLENPDRSTTWIDTKNVTLSPGMAWETVATVDGCGYWTIVGNGAVIGGSGTNAVLTIRDFEGNDIMTVTKGEHRLAWLESSDFTGQSRDANNWVCFDMRADVQPTGYYSTTLEMADFVAETDAGCPAQYRWENMGGGVWRVHFLLKPGIVSDACFAKFQVEVEGQTIIRYNAGQEISGGLIYNGVKIAPDISGHPAVGTVIQWKVVN